MSLHIIARLISPYCPRIHYLFHILLIDINRTLIHTFCTHTWPLLLVHIVPSYWKRTYIFLYFLKPFVIVDPPSLQVPYNHKPPNHWSPLWNRLPIITTYIPVLIFAVYQKTVDILIPYFFIFYLINILTTFVDRRIIIFTYYVLEINEPFDPSISTILSITFINRMFVYSYELLLKLVIVLFFRYLFLKPFQYHIPFKSTFIILIVSLTIFLIETFSFDIILFLFFYLFLRSEYFPVLLINPSFSFIFPIFIDLNILFITIPLLNYPILLQTVFLFKSNLIVPDKFQYIFLLMFCYILVLMF